jgi:polyhydroxyalkanoate synthesis regulator protein
MAMFEQAMKMFMPTLYNSSRPEKSSSSSSPAGSMMEMQAEALANMQAQMSAIQDQLAELYRKD